MSAIRETTAGFGRAAANRGRQTGLRHRRSRPQRPLARGQQFVAIHHVVQIQALCGAATSHDGDTCRDGEPIDSYIITGRDAR